MTTYADPTRCPDCRGQLPHAPQACPACALPLTGETAASLFATLLEADRLLGTLRLQKQSLLIGAGGPSLEGVAAYPIAGPRTEAAPSAPRLRGASVPKILLSLGALCLLVAAVIFLAVAWSWLGVGGRTSVLIALTGAAAAGAVIAAQRGLRTAAESFSAVSLGLLAVDVAGIRHAGWFVPVDDSYVVLLGGTVVAAGALLLLVSTAPRPLTVPALALPVAVLVAGVAAEVDRTVLVPLALTLVVILGCARVGLALPSRSLLWASVVVGAVGWNGLVASSVHQLLESPVTVSRYPSCWPLLVALLTAVAVGPVCASRRLTQAGYAVTGLTATGTVLLPALDNGTTAATWSLTVAGLVWVGVVMVVDEPLRPAAVVPLAATLLAPALAAVSLVADAARAVLSTGAPFSAPADVRIPAPVTDVSPLLLLPALLVAAAACCAVARLARPVSREAWGLTLGGALALGGLATLPLYGAPLATVVALVLALAAAAALSSGTEPAVFTAIGLGAVAALAALPSDVLTAAALLVVCAIAATRMAASGSAGAAVCLPLAFAGLAWAGGNVVELPDQLRALPVLVVLGALAVWRPRPELEAASAVAGTLASTAAVLLSPDLDVWLAVHLTVAGVLVTASSILHPSRRLLAWPGGLLLAAATWVRLDALGVHVPEAYTLPSAVVLTAVGLRQLRRDERAATLTVLAPGLALATVPSLVAMLQDPYSPRALLLGAACLGLTLGGALARWSAPLVVGAVVGAVLVLRELAPYAAQVPSWLTIAAAGAALLAVGVTWESRMRDVRRASRYVAALR